MSQKTQRLDAKVSGRRVCCLLTVLLGGLWLAMPAAAITLPDAVRQGVATHPAVQSAESEVASAATQVDIARDSYWPSVEMSAGPENSLTGEVGYDITATQVLYDWGKIDAQVDNASAQHRQKLAALKVKIDEVALDIIETYLDVLAARQRVAEVESYINELDKLRDLTVDRGTGGYADRSETERARLDLARAREQLSIEQGSLHDARRQFRVLVNQPPSSLQRPDPLIMADRFTNDQQIRAAVREAPRLRQSRAQVEAARAELEESKARLKPQLNLEGSVLRRKIGGEMEEDTVLELRVRLEPFQGLSNFRQADAARQQVEASEWSQRAAHRDLRREITSLVEQDDVLAWRLEALREQVDNAANVMTTYRDQFDAGFRDVADLLSIERDYFEAKRQMADLTVERLRIQYQIAAQLGQLGQVLGRPLSESTADEQGAP
ncbi:TolC family protein [Halomonas halmophila]|uniref:Uncharacterized protein n=1 Tax=Halomonas halmophila TaxID=252 RepID=A0A4Y4F0M5_9GAMM|nr:TolC family protein [Halomonas halmophila]GED23639.1 hypothetical protein HHA01_26160 [Halomonas halmophila]